MNHTQTPWHIHKVGFDTADIGSADANALTCTAFGVGREEVEANAARIVYAVNTIDATIAERDAAIARVGELEVSTALALARWNWWRENGDCIADDGDGVIGVAFSCQMSLSDLQSLSTAEMMDRIADFHLALSAAKVGEGQ